MHINQTNLDLLSHERIIEIVSLFLLMVVSSFLNITTCVIIARNKLLRERPANAFVANLCLSNMVLTLFVIPFSLATLVRDQHGAYTGTACTINGFISVAGCSAIVTTLCCISIDRYVAVNKPTKYRTILTLRRAHYMILVTWFQAVLYASFPLLGWSYYEYHPGTLHCAPVWTSDCSLYIFLSIAGFAIPLAVMFMTYARIFQVIRRHSKRVANLKFAVPGSASFQANALFSEMQQQDSPSPEIQNVYMDYPTASNGIALQNGSNECVLIPSAIVTQGAGNVSRFFKQGEVLSPADGQYLPPLEERRDHEMIAPSCDLFGELKLPQVNEASSAVLSDSRLKVKKRSIRAIFQNFRTSIRSRRQAERQLPREYKIAKTGLVLLMLFLILWLPYLVVNACTTKLEAPESVFHAAMWLVYMNGVANPIAYAFGNKRVKTKFRLIFQKIFSIVPRCR